ERVAAFGNHPRSESPLLAAGQTDDLNCCTASQIARESPALGNELPSMQLVVEPGAEMLRSDPESGEPVDPIVEMVAPLWSHLETLHSEAGVIASNVGPPGANLPQSERCQAEVAARPYG